jgi:hypothetical protein
MPIIYLTFLSSATLLLRLLRIFIFTRQYYELGALKQIRPPCPIVGTSLQTTPAPCHVLAEYHDRVPPNSISVSIRIIENQDDIKYSIITTNVEIVVESKPRIINHLSTNNPPPHFNGEIC